MIVMNIPPILTLSTEKGNHDINEDDLKTVEEV